MLSKKFSFANRFIFAVITLCLVNEGVSTGFFTCYHCGSWNDTECRTSPKPEFKYNCYNQRYDTIKDFPIPMYPMTYDQHMSTFEEDLRADITNRFFRCITLHGHPKNAPNRNFVARTCVPRVNNEDFYIKQAKKANVILTNVEICETEQCNSSSSISISFWALVASIATLYLYQK